MADNVPITSGSGTNIATDDVSGVHFQKVKLDLGGDGASSPVSGSLPTAGDVAHNSADAGNPVKIGGKASTTAPTSVTSGDRVDAWFSVKGTQYVSLADSVGNELKMGQANDGLSAAGFLNPVPYLYNGATRDIQRTVSVGDAAAATGIAAAGLMGYNGSTWDRVRTANTGRLQVDVVTAPALPAGTNNIGDVDVLTVPAPLSTTGGGTEATAHRVTIANDSTGVLSVDDNGGSLTVDGTVAVSSLPALVAGTANIGDVDVLTLPALPAGTNNIGDVDVLTVPAPHVTGSTALGFSFAFTTTQTSANLIAGTGGQRIYVTNLTIGTGGTTAGRVSVYHGTGTLATAITANLVIFDAEFAPSATVRPGAVLTFPIPIGGASATGDNLRITTSAAMTVYVTGQAYKA